MIVLCLMTDSRLNLYASDAAPVADFPPAASAASHSSRNAATYHRALLTGKRPTRRPSHPFSRRLREFVHKYRDSYATCACLTQSDPGPCRARTTLPG